MLDSVEFEILVEDFVGRFNREVETEVFEEYVFVQQDRVSPAPVIFRLLIDDEVGVLLCDATAGNDEFLDFAAVLFDFGCKKDGGGGNLLETGVS